MIILLVIIYLAFIGLGLPDGLLGSGWPSMYQSLGVQLSGAGIISMIISGGTIISSLFSDRLIKKFSTGIVTFISVLMTAGALVGISLSKQYLLICFWAIPLGLGAGSVDAALNNFVALYYKAKHMNWLHSFWGIGASLGPVIMGITLSKWGSWRWGYGVVGIIQLVIVMILALSLPLWKKAQKEEKEEKEGNATIGLKGALQMKGVKPILTTFFAYCAVEATVGLWGSSYLVLARGLNEEKAAGLVALFFFGITFGRFLSGFLAIKLSHKQMMVSGLTAIGAGIILLFLPFSTVFAWMGLFLMGLGCAPIFPSLLHETPVNFGKENSQAIMGVQMASAYVGTTVMPPLFGLLGNQFTFKLFPIFLAFCFALMVIMFLRAKDQLKNRS